MKALTLIDKLNDTDIVCFCTRDGKDIITTEAINILNLEDNIIEWMLSHEVVSYEMHEDEDKHYVRVGCLLETLPRVYQVIPILSGVSHFGVHFDDYNEVMSKHNVMAECSKFVITSMHVCDESMRDNFEMELWLADVE